MPRIGILLLLLSCLLCTVTTGLVVGTRCGKRTPQLPSKTVSRGWWPIFGCLSCRKPARCEPQPPVGNSQLLGDVMSEGSDISRQACFSQIPPESEGEKMTPPPMPSDPRENRGKARATSAVVSIPRLPQHESVFQIATPRAPALPPDLQEMQSFLE